MKQEDLMRMYMYRTELHAHTKPASGCADFSPEEVVKTYSKLEVDTLVITNHLLYHPSLSAKDYAEKYLNDYYNAVEAARDSNMNIVLGAEIRFVNTVNDYLVYGISPEDIEEIFSYLNTDICHFYKNFKSSKNVIMQAHPFRDNMEKIPLGAIDGIEVFNCHINHNSRIAKAAKYAAEHNLPICGGSDYHHLGHEGTCLMRTKTKLRDSFDVAEAIKSQDIVFDMFGNIIFV